MNKSEHLQRERERLRAHLEELDQQYKKKEKNAGGEDEVKIHIQNHRKISTFT